ncbi:hypothetical protein GF362_02890 [Candidatus Dojkabacteria bacterium]|nr:hypothetical protein [Candidatus Dojkabacteria bacterium]
MSIFNNLFTPLNIAVVLLIAISIAFIIRLIKKKKKLSIYFHGHVNHDILDLIIKKYNHINISGEQRILTVMFIDIKGFTALSENLSNKKIVELLNTYFSDISKIIFTHYGTVDKYIGDTVMAFWGAPLLDRYQASNALKAAIEIQNYFQQKGRGIRIGINTGPVLVGNIGNPNMMSYTAIGDSVNVASRLESLCKQYGVNILFSKSTKEKLQSEVKSIDKEVFWREIDKVRVYGRREVTYIYELIGSKERILPREISGYEYFEDGLICYRNGNWEKAESLFRRASRRLNKDKASKTFIKRCKKFQISPPKGKWNGTLTLLK